MMVPLVGRRSLLLWSAGGDLLFYCRLSGCLCSFVFDVALTTGSVEIGLCWFLCLHYIIVAQLYQDGVLHIITQRYLCTLYSCATIRYVVYCSVVGGVDMGKASTKAQNKYIAKAYDRVNLTMPKGKKDEVQVHASQQGESVNAFINRAIDEAMERDKAEK